MCEKVLPKNILPLLTERDQERFQKTIEAVADMKDHKICLCSLNDQESEDR